MEKIDETAALVMGAALSVSSNLLKESTMKEPTSPEVRQIEHQCSKKSSSLPPRPLHPPPPTNGSEQLYTMQIADALPKKLRLSRSELDQYLKALADDEVCII